MADEVRYHCIHARFTVTARGSNPPLARCLDCGEVLSAIRLLAADIATHHQRLQEASDFEDRMAVEDLLRGMGIKCVNR